MKCRRVASPGRAALSDAFAGALAGALFFASAAQAQAPHDLPPPTGRQAADPMAGHDMSSMPGHDMAAMDMPSDDHQSMRMTSAFGPYPMTRDGSGTSWQPEATPMQGLHWTSGAWSLMAHGFVNAIDNFQSGPRGDHETFAQSMAMLMGNRRVGPGTLGLRAMLSLDPAQGRRGYPLLFQTGETADGKTALVDRQHPHDFFMELSASYSVPFGANGSTFVYAGLPGEPALGPPAYMHRFSGMRDPEAPLTHHWLDSTHITFGVVTLGASQGPLQLEGSWFNGREPDQARWNIETRRFDSWSTRLSYNPLPALSMQASFGDLKSPEQLEPDVRVRRTTASVTYHVDRGDAQWATTLAYGRNQKIGPSGRTTEPGALLESTYVLDDTHTFFARAEQVRNTELFDESYPLHGRALRIRKLSVGYLRDVATIGASKWGIGGLVGFIRAPSALDADYGRRPRSYLLFVQGRL